MKYCSNTEQNMIMFENIANERRVRYEEIHGIKSSDFDKLVNSVNPESKHIILDAGAGYGAVTREIIKRNTEKEIIYYIADISRSQLERAKIEIADVLKDYVKKYQVSYYQDNIINSNFKENSFDRVIAKMVIHEVKKEFQQAAVFEMYRILKPGGKLIVWDVYLDESVQHFVQAIIRKKDEIAGFCDLVDNRYLFNIEEIFKIIKKAGFNEIKKDFDLSYTFSTRKRMEAEFNGDLKKMNCLNDFIKSESLKYPNISKHLELKITSNDISLNIPKAIIIASK